jgi:hypothetical protein
MQSILQLQNNPNVQNILSDPALMQQIHANDFDALMQNPKIQQLMNDSAMRDLTRQMR